MKHFIIAALLLFTSAHAQSSYTLVPEKSKLVFTSIKSSSVIEAHEFKSLSGEINEQGLASVTIDLASVETGIDIRNERMKSMLFHVEKYAQALVQTEVSLSALKNLKVGESFHRHVPVSVELHGQKQDLVAHSDVVKTSESTVTIYSTKPVLVNAAEFDLVKGIAALQKIAGLPSIATSVPVTFKLVFKLD
ncbi:hypothetical protein GCM10009128_12030 [Psychrosphaera haliotis]|uniref:YceI family protein n=1 Tax=Psychrosphaera haliotis TaxID=555083 RepID=UPI0031CED77B